MLTIRPNRLAIIPSIVDLISMIADNMLASIALIQSSRDQVRKSPGGGPPALLIRMSGEGHAARSASRPAVVVTSEAMLWTVPPHSLAISPAACRNRSSSRAAMKTVTPSRASAEATPRPNPALAPQTMADLPAIPRSTMLFSLVRAALVAPGTGPLVAGHAPSHVVHFQRTEAKLNLEASGRARIK